MAQRATVKSEWNGEKFAAAARVALGRGLIGIGERVVVLGKEHADVISGTMVRSIHAAPAEYDGSSDETTAATQDMGGQPYKPTMKDEQIIIEVGSWVPYACVEEVSRGHQFMTPAVQEMQGARSNAIMVQSFREEGMKIKPL